MHMNQYKVHLMQVNEEEGRDRLARAMKTILDHAIPIHEGMNRGPAADRERAPPERGRG